jgi:hypothetical protein
MDGGGELDQRRGRQGAMGVEHDGAVGANFFAGLLDEMPCGGSLTALGV